MGWWEGREGKRTCPPPAAATPLSSRPAHIPPTRWKGRAGRAVPESGHRPFHQLEAVPVNPPRWTQNRASSTTNKTYYGNEEATTADPPPRLSLPSSRGRRAAPPRNPPRRLGRSVPPPPPARGPTMDAAITSAAPTVAPAEHVFGRALIERFQVAALVGSGRGQESFVRLGSGGCRTPTKRCPKMELLKTRYLGIRKQLLS